MNRRSSGDPGIDWMKDFSLRRGRPFEKALVLNCGSGWVERELLRIGAVKSIFATDIAPDLIGFARAKADEMGLPITYVLGDANTGDLPLEGVDLVVNHAACHHLTNLDRILGTIADQLPDDGWFVSFDYVGAHRNQYSADQWEAALYLNDRAPEHLRSAMGYPHLPTMLAGDPSEAVHSELFLETCDRYFTPLVDRPIGGWLAYLVLTANESLFDHLGPDADQWVAEVVRCDEAVVEADPSKTLFNYRIGQPKRPGPSAEQRAEWAGQEVAREAAAAANGGVYYAPTAIARYWQPDANDDAARRRPEEMVHSIPGKLLAEHLLRRIQPVRRLKSLAAASAGLLSAGKTAPQHRNGFGTPTPPSKEFVLPKRVGRRQHRAMRSARPTERGRHE